MMIILSDWTDWDKLDEETAKVILDQGEKYLKELNEAADVLTSRSINILQISVPSIALLVGFLFSNYSIGLAPYLVINAAFFLISISIFAIIVNRLYTIRPLGNEPRKIITNEKVYHKKQTLVFLYNAIKTVQKAIDQNKELNRKRVEKIKTIQILLLIGLVSEVIVCPVLYYLMLCRF